MHALVVEERIGLVTFQECDIAKYAFGLLIASECSTFFGLLFA